MTRINWDLYINEPYCVDIDECSNGFVCPRKSICQNTGGSFICKCDQGFGGDLCEDIDECTQPGSCDANAACLNTKGGYECSRNSEFRGNGITCKVGQCEDIRCPPDQKCISPTSNECQCNEGLSFNTFTEFCEDVDECLLDHGCDQNSTCVNSKGSFSCVCQTGYVGDGKTCEEGNCTDDMCSINAECVTPSSFECRCKNGFELKLWESNATEICVDTDECSNLRGICHEKAVCLNFPGGYECNCQKGYFGNGQTCFPGSCSDSNCSPSQNQMCVSPRTNDCKCMEGYHFNNLSVCVDVDECSTLKSICHEKAECMNLPGEYECNCQEGYFGDDQTCSPGNCTDINCSPSDHEKCVSPRSNLCKCTEGFAFNNLSVCVPPPVLVLSTEYGIKTTLVNAKGQSNVTISFGKGTDVSYSCSVTFHNRFYVFGGENEKRQISEVTQCELRRIGSLDFDHDSVACSNVDDREIYLCFDKKDQKQCLTGNDPLGKFTKITSSTHDHVWARTAASTSKFQVTYILHIIFSRITRSWQ